jgi:hypothetical protein
MITRMPTTLALRLALWGWFFAAIAASHYRVFQKLPVSALAGLLLSLSALLIMLYRRFAAVRAGVDAIDLRSLIVVHLTRLAGIYLLVLYRRGDLPYGFAVPAGIGDTLVALAALGLLVVPMNEATRTRATYIWNVAGLVDLMLVVFSALRLGLVDPDSLSPFAALPLSLLPTFLVPLIIASHLAIYARLSRQPG